VPTSRVGSSELDTVAGPIDIVPLAAAIGGLETVSTIELALGEFSVRVITINEVIARRRSSGARRTRPRFRLSTPPVRLCADTDQKQEVLDAPMRKWPSAESS
jgi:hypothetical protein